MEPTNKSNQEKTVNTLELTEHNLRTAWTNGCQSVKDVLQDLFPNFKFIKKEKVYHIGDMFLSGLSKYLIVQIDAGRCVLIDLKTGNRWTEPVIISSPVQITEEEFKKMVGDLYTKLSYYGNSSNIL